MNADKTLAQIIVSTMREIGTTPDPDQPTSLLVNVKDLEAVIDEHLDEWLMTYGDGSPEGDGKP